MDSHARSIAKAVSYRLLGSLASTGVFFVLTQNVKLSLGAGVLDTIVKVFLYFAHERLWERIHFGRGRPPEYEI